MPQQIVWDIIRPNSGCIAIANTWTFMFIITCSEFCLSLPLWIGIAPGPRSKDTGSNLRLITLVCCWRLTLSWMPTHGIRYWPIRSQHCFLQQITWFQCLTKTANEYKNWRLNNHILDSPSDCGISPPYNVTKSSPEDLQRYLDSISNKEQERKNTKLGRKGEYVHMYVIIIGTSNINVVLILDCVYRTFKVFQKNGWDCCEEKGDGRRRNWFWDEAEGL